jgi:hypothetical protein
MIVKTMMTKAGTCPPLPLLIPGAANSVAPRTTRELAYFILPRKVPGQAGR